MAQLMSYVIIVSSLIVPMFLMFIVLRSHSLYEVKRYKERFSTILIKIDKTNYVHLVLPLFFFFRNRPSTELPWNGKTYPQSSRKMVGVTSSMKSRASHEKVW